MARAARARSSSLAGCRTTTLCPPTSPKISGAHCREASQSMQVSSTNQGPGTLPGCRRATLAIRRLSPTRPGRAAVVEAQVDDQLADVGEGGGAVERAVGQAGQ